MSGRSDTSGRSVTCLIVGTRVWQKCHMSDSRDTCLAEVSRVWQKCHMSDSSDTCLAEVSHFQYYRYQFKTSMGYIETDVSYLKL